MRSPNVQSAHSGNWSFGQQSKYIDDLLLHNLIVHTTKNLHCSSDSCSTINPKCANEVETLMGRRVNREVERIES